MSDPTPMHLGVRDDGALVVTTDDHKLVLPLDAEQRLQIALLLFAIDHADAPAQTQRYDA